VTYIGQQPATTFDSGIQDRFTGLTTNTVTLTHDISAETDILVVWNNIVQDSSTYSVGGTGNRTLNLGGTLSSGDVVTVYYTNRVMQSVNPTAGSVTTTTINDGAVTNDKLAGSIANSKLANSSITLNGSAVSLGGSATVTPSVTPDNLQYFAPSSNQTISANSQTTITTYGNGQITGRLLYNYGTQYVTHSSGIFSFSTEGYYHVVLRVSGSQTASGGTATGHVYLDSTTNNSSYGDAIDVNLSVATATGGFNSYFDGIFKITDTSNHKLRSSIYLPQGGEVGGGGGTRMRTFMRFARLGTTT
jgi:hypothetical protein